MAETSPRPTNPWLAFAAGAVVAVAVVMVWLAWSGASRISEAVPLAIPAPRLADVPLPSLPDAPRIPDAPVPRPR